MTGSFTAKYTDEQRQALADAYETSSARVVVDRAARGTLTLDGVPLPAFEANANAIRSIAQKDRKRRGVPTSHKASATPVDVIGKSRDELARVCRSGIAELRRKQRRGEDVAAEEAAKWLTVLRGTNEIWAASDPPRDRITPVLGQSEPAGVTSLGLGLIESHRQDPGDGQVPVDTPAQRRVNALQTAASLRPETLA